MSELREILREIEKRRRDIEILFNNYHESINNKDYFKASEDLWGIVNSEMAIISLLLGKRLPSSHGELRALAHSLGRLDHEIPDLFRSAETLHANFYHNFLDEDRFSYERLRVERLIEKLDQVLRSSI